MSITHESIRENFIGKSKGAVAASNEPEKKHVSIEHLVDQQAKASDASETLLRDVVHKLESINHGIEGLSRTAANQNRLNTAQNRQNDNVSAMLQRLLTRPARVSPVSAPLTNTAAPMAAGFAPRMQPRGADGRYQTYGPPAPFRGYGPPAPLRGGNAPALPVTPGRTGPLNARQAAAAVINGRVGQYLRTPFNLRNDVMAPASKAWNATAGFVQARGGRPYSYQGGAAQQALGLPTTRGPSLPPLTPAGTPPPIASQSGGMLGTGAQVAGGVVAGSAAKSLGSRALGLARGAAGGAGRLATRALPAAGMVALAKEANDRGILKAPDMSQGWGRGALEFLDPGIADAVYGKRAPAEANGASKQSSGAALGGRPTPSSSDEPRNARNARADVLDELDGDPRGRRIRSKELSTPGAMKPEESTMLGRLGGHMAKTLGQDAGDVNKALGKLGLPSDKLAALQKMLEGYANKQNLGSVAPAPGSTNEYSAANPGMNRSTEDRSFGSSMSRRGPGTARPGGNTDTGVDRVAPGTVVTPGIGQSNAAARRDVAQQQAQAAMPSYSPGMSGSGAVGATMAAPTEMGGPAAATSITGLPLTMGGGNGESGSARTQAPGNKAVSNMIDYKPESMGEKMGINTEQWTAFRKGVSSLESPGKYDLMGGSAQRVAGGRFAGRYQMGGAEIEDAAKKLGEQAPTKTVNGVKVANDDFLKDPKMQERYFERNTQTNHEALMRGSPEYRAMSPEQKLEALGYAHNQGAGSRDKGTGAAGYLATGKVGTDGFGTAGNAYNRAVRNELAAGTGKVGMTASGPAVSTAGLPQAGGNSSRASMDDLMKGATPSAPGTNQFGQGRPGAGAPGVAPDGSAPQIPQVRQGETEQQLAARIKQTNPSLGNGECVALAKQAAGSVGQGVGEWRKGQSAADGTLPIGTPIATFKNRDGTDSDKYDGGQGVGISSRDSKEKYGQQAGTTHAAVVRGYERDASGKVTGVKVWEQWRGSGGPRDNTYAIGDKRGNEKDGANYYSVNDTKGRPIGDERNPMNRLLPGSGDRPGEPQVAARNIPITAPDMPGAGAAPKRNAFGGIDPLAGDGRVTGPGPEVVNTARPQALDNDGTSRSFEGAGRRAFGLGPNGFMPQAVGAQGFGRQATANSFGPNGVAESFNPATGQPNTPTRAWVDPPKRQPPTLAPNSPAPEAAPPTAMAPNAGRGQALSPQGRVVRTIPGVGGNPMDVLGRNGAGAMQSMEYRGSGRPNPGGLAGLIQTLESRGTNGVTPSSPGIVSTTENRAAPGAWKDPAKPNYIPASTETNTVLPDAWKTAGRSGSFDASESGVKGGFLGGAFNASSRGWRNEPGKQAVGDFGTGITPNSPAKADPVAASTPQGQTAQAKADAPTPSAVANKPQAAADVPTMNKTERQGMQVAANTTEKRPSITEMNTMDEFSSMVGNGNEMA